MIIIYIYNKILTKQILSNLGTKIILVNILTSTDEIKRLRLDGFEVDSGHVEASSSASLHDNLTIRLSQSP